MRNILKFVFIFLIFSNVCKSQIINIRDRGTIKLAPGQYYKDIDNLLNPFVGTWLFQNGNVSLKIILNKRVNHSNDKYTEDYIYGGVEYKLNNNVLLNTLSDAYSVYTWRMKYSINGYSILENNYIPVCNDCLPGEYRLRLMYNEPDSILGGVMYIRKILINGQECLKILLLEASEIYYEEGTPTPPDHFIVPFGEYTLIKQP